MKIRKHLACLIILLAFSAGNIAGCKKQKGAISQPSTLKTKAVEYSSLKTENQMFTGFYSLEPLEIKLKVSPYDLPLDKKEIKNFKDFSKKVSLSPEALKSIEKNGFVVIENPFFKQEEYFTNAYKTLKTREIPVFITTDSLLHLYHIQFDETLRQIEEKEFFGLVWDISMELFDESTDKHESASGDLKEAYKRNTAYFAVALSLLQPKPDQACTKDNYNCHDAGPASAYFKKEDLKTYSFSIPAFVKDDVEKELKLIKEHKGFSNSPLFIYKEDYSQYVPRGHYTRSEKLKNYFKALMWYGRISMLLKGSDAKTQGLIPAEEAKIQTMQASVIVSKFEKSAKLKESWDRIYSVTAFYVGLSDDLGPYEYMDAMNHVFGETFDPKDLTEETVEKLKAKLAEYRPPKINGGTGDCEIAPPFTPEQANQCLESTKGFRLMGQRFIPDSYMFSNLVSPFSGGYTGKDCAAVFTCGMTDEGPWRVFPRGLDVMALLGSKRAGEILKDMDDSNYSGYAKKFAELKEEVDGFGDSEWHQNLYWSWLYALMPLLQQFPDGYPTFMQTVAWNDKELSTALASWAELRHDTILYAKQSYTMRTDSEEPPIKEKPVVGYIEPAVEFYNRLLALTRMTNKGLSKMNVLDPDSLHRLEALEEILEKLVLLSAQELENKELTKEDYDFIKNFADSLNHVIADVDSKAKKTTIIADVHTDSNSGNVLEEGIGYVKLLVVAYKVPDDRILIGAGPVFSYFEFKHPMNDRLTDEKWRKMLTSNAPDAPSWTSTFIQ